MHNVSVDENVIFPSLTLFIKATTNSECNLSKEVTHMQLGNNIDFSSAFDVAYHLIIFAYEIE